MEDIAPPKKRGRPKVADRWTEVDAGYESPCWLWKLAKLPNGYGFERRGERMGYAHRHAYERHHPENTSIDHLCRVRACVNPLHLEAVTPAENTRRGRSTKLTVEDVREIRRSHAPQRVLARRYGISQSQVSRIKRRHSWTDVCD